MGQASARPKGVARHDPATRGVVPPGPSTLDLHSHTARSDGLLEPIDLAIAARAAGVRLLAITDHDTLAGFREVRALLSAGGANADGGADRGDPRNSGPLSGLELMPGIELNAVMVNRPELMESEVHILGFGMDPEDDAFETILQAQRGERRVRFGRMVIRLREIGLPVDHVLGEVPPSGEDAALGRPTLARAMVSLGYAQSVEDAFVRFLSRGKPAYVPRGGLGPIEAIGAIRDAGGVPVLAHFSEAPERRDLLAELMAEGLRGLEVYHGSFDAPTVARLHALATELGLLATGGTDFHGDRETYAEAYARLWVPPEVEPVLRAAMDQASPAASVAPATFRP
jgi:predicted metal-dependent phosphoesterase TrpH